MTELEKHELRHKKRMDKLEYKARKKEIRSRQKRISYSKGILAVILLVLFMTLIYSMYEMHVQKDLSALSALITGVAVTALSALISYMWKSAKENTAGGIIYETTMKQPNQLDNKEKEDAQKEEDTKEHKAKRIIE